MRDDQRLSLDSCRVELLGLFRRIGIGGSSGKTATGKTGFGFESLDMRIEGADESHLLLRECSIDFANCRILDRRILDKSVALLNLIVIGCNLTRHSSFCKSWQNGNVVLGCYSLLNTRTNGACHLKVRVDSRHLIGSRRTFANRCCRNRCLCLGGCLLLDRNARSIELVGILTKFACGLLNTFLYEIDRIDGSGILLAHRLFIIYFGDTAKHIIGFRHRAGCTDDANHRSSTRLGRYH